MEKHFEHGNYTTTVEHLSDGSVRISQEDNTKVSYDAVVVPKHIARKLAGRISPINFWRSFGMCLLSIALFTGFCFLGSQCDGPDTTQPDPINYDLYEYRFNELEGRIDSLQNQFKTISHEITKDSIAIVNAPRSKRDSIRAVINPR
jgi:hypothetical protein